MRWRSEPDGLRRFRFPDAAGVASSALTQWWWGFFILGGNGLLARPEYLVFEDL
jgi:hypothetical protein